MLPRLEAEETLADARTVALGSGTMPERERKRLVATLERRAQAGAGARRRLGPTTEAGRAALAMMGIAVEVHDG